MSGDGCTCGGRPVEIGGAEHRPGCDIRMPWPVLPDPGCSFAYPLGQVREILGDKTDAFWWWMRKRPMGFCDGQRWSSVLSCYEPSECDRAHSFVVYPVDLARFLQEAAA